MRDRRQKRSLRTTALRFVLALLLVLSAGATTTGCEEEAAAPPPQNPAAPAPAQGRGRARGGEQKAEVNDSAEVAWAPRRNWERRPVEGRDPFIGFIDILIAERAKEEELAAQQQLAEEEVLLPSQKFDVRDFSLVAIITNTAEPKVLFIDPDGQAHHLKEGDLFGNRNGVLVDIRRGEIEVLQGEDPIHNPEIVVMKLHPETAAGLRVEVK